MNRPAAITTTAGNPYSPSQKEIAITLPSTIVGKAREAGDTSAAERDAESAPQ